MDLGAIKYTFPMKIVGKKHTFPIWGLAGGGAVAEWGGMSAREGRFGAM